MLWRRADHEARGYGHNTTLRKIVQSGRLDAKKLVSYRFVSEIMPAYDTFRNAAKERALKEVLKNARTSGRA
jgi:threonine dehydrogenase-like Zn-dependent dehydrogenase